MKGCVEAEFFEEVVEVGGNFFRAVAIRAEVTEDDTVEGGMRDVADEFFDLDVG